MVWNLQFSIEKNCPEVGGFAPRPPWFLAVDDRPRLWYAWVATVCLVRCSIETFFKQKILFFGPSFPPLQLTVVARLPMETNNRMDRVCHTETVDSGSIPGWVESKTIKLVFIAFPAWRAAIKRDSVKPPPCVVNRWAGGSLTRRLKGPFAVSWPRQLGQ